MRKLLSAILVVWIATIGADRVDFLAGRGSFILTPFLVLSPLVLYLILLQILATRSSSCLRLPPSAGRFAYLITILVALILISALWGNDGGLSFKRSALLVVQVYCSLAIAIIISNMPRPGHILLHGAYLGIGLSCLFGIAQLVNWLSAFGSARSYGLPFVNLMPVSPFTPRFSGVSLDMNRGAALLIVYAFLVFKLGVHSRWRTTFLCTALSLMLMTFSRSAAIGFLLMVAALLLQGLRVRLADVLKVALVLLALCLVGAYLINRSETSAHLDVAELVRDRLLLAEQYSGGVHLALVGRAVEVADHSVKSILLGIGFGNSYTVLQDFFPGSKYGNFHSGYLTFLVECGILSLIVFLLICVLPLKVSRDYLPLMLALLWFNVFYQQTLEPMFWFFVALAWTNTGFPREGSLIEQTVCV